MKYIVLQYICYVFFYLSKNDCKKIDQHIVNQWFLAQSDLSTCTFSFVHYVPGMSREKKTCLDISMHQ